MLTAAKEGTSSASSDPCVLFPLAAGEGVPENSRLGFATKRVALHQGSAWSNSGKALGIEAVVWENCGGPDDGARYYNPTLQRFISEDPIGFNGGDVNLYAYVWNSPTNFLDPVGEFGWPRHVQITNDALALAGLSPDPGMAQQVAAVDTRPGSQGTDSDATNTHAMSGITTGRKPHRQSCSEAYQATQDQIAQDVRNGDLTKALHTIQDPYSPSHYGFQFWDGGWGWFHIPSAGHMYGDFFPPQSAIDGATNASAQFLRDITQNPSGPFGPIDPSRYLPANACGQ